MSSTSRSRFTAAVAVITSIASSPPQLRAQIGPNPYRPVAWGDLPDGREWGPLSGIFADPDGRHIWFADRCGPTPLPSSTQEGCLFKPDIAPILKLDLEGNLVESFGEGLFDRPHGLFVDRDGNVWVTDASAGEAYPYTADEVRAEMTRRRIGHQVHKFSPDGELSMSLGTAGVPGDGPNHFRQPSDVLVAPTGEIFVADGHGEGGNNRIVKFSSDGSYIMEWGQTGTALGQLLDPHDLAMDSQGRLFVADRGNARIQIFDQVGNLLDVWTQFGKPDGLFIDANDVLYAADANSRAGSHTGWEEGIRIGDARTGWVQAFILSPSPAEGPGGWEGVTADIHGNVYATEPRPSMDVRRSQYVQKFINVRARPVERRDW
jgi:DNA-binding beta-propeller fold protein YncE